MFIRQSSTLAALVLAAASAAAGLGATAANAQTTIVDEWASVKAPPAPELKPVALNPKTTALLMLDFTKQNCNQERRPRCVTSLAPMKALLAQARAKNVTVIHSLTSTTTKADILPEVAPNDSEAMVQASADKFNRTDLEKILKDKGITTVVVVGTAAQGAVLHTAASAAFKGFKVVVPVDGMSAEETYFEQYTAYHLTKGPGLATAVTLTKSSTVKFE